MTKTWKEQYRTYQPKQRKCPNCGAPFSSDWKYACEYCGFEYKATPLPITASPGKELPRPRPTSVPGPGKKMLL